MKSKLSIGLLRKAGRCQQSRIRLTQEGDSGWAAPPLQMLGDAPLGGSQPSVRTEGGHPARTSVQSFVAVFHLLPSTPAFFAGGAHTIEHVVECISSASVFRVSEGRGTDS